MTSCWMSSPQSLNWSSHPRNCCRPVHLNWMTSPTNWNSTSCFHPPNWMTSPKRKKSRPGAHRKNRLDHPGRPDRRLHRRSFRSDKGPCVRCSAPESRCREAPDHRRHHRHRRNCCRPTRKKNCHPTRKNCCRHRWTRNRHHRWSLNWSWTRNSTSCSTKMKSCWKSLTRQYPELIRRFS